MFKGLFEREMKKKCELNIHIRARWKKSYFRSAWLEEGNKPEILQT